ncbi:MAG: YqeG family HAD IIIA-type phosphatase [Oscillospiraceae bacterium]|nr:YqeG family HAD IIIA-type phosphatase [Oscillospiraceae bacterium]
MNFYPDIVLRSVQEITPEWMSRYSIKGLLLDLDNTLAGYRVKTPDTATSEWLKSMREAGYGLIVLSNAGKRRVEAFCAPLELPYVAGARKPKPEALLEACGRIGICPRDAAMVGDQIFTDVLAANRARITSVIVEPVTRNMLFNFRRNVLERRFINEKGRL